MKRIPQLFMAAIAALSAAVSQAVSIETIEFDEGYGITTSVPFDGTAYTADAGATVSFTATGENFECWFDGAGNKLGTEPTLTFTAEADTKIIPFFGKVPWQFIKYKTSSGTSYGVITNMYGSLPTDYKTADNLSLSTSDSGYLSVSYVPILDLTGPMSLADGTACSIKRSAYQKGPKWPSGLTEYRLPPLFSTTHSGSGGMSNGKFGGNVKIVISDDNVISSLGTGAFTGNKGLAGDYVFTNLTSIGSYVFQNTLITSCVFGEGLVSVSDRTFDGCSALTNLVCQSTTTLTFLVSNGRAAVQSCTALTDYTFFCVPTFQASWNKGSKKDREVRFHIPRSGTDWDAIIASDSFEKWADSSDEDKAAYNAAFPDGPTPVGYYTGENVGAWIVFQASGEAMVAELTIASNGEELGEVDPGYGIIEGVTEPRVCTVTTPKAINADRTMVYQCTGWSTETFDGEWVPSASGSELAYTFAPTGNEVVKLTWNWEPVAYRVEVVVPDGGYSVTTHVASNAGLDGADDFYLPGTVVTYTAAGENFERWYGVPDGVDATQREITFTVTGPMVIVPFFSGVPWTYASSRITNAYWNVSVSLSGDSITLGSGATYVGRVPVLDMTGPITTTAGSPCYIRGTVQSPAWGPDVKELRLALTHTSINQGAVSNGKFPNGSPVTIVSPDNIITSLGGGAFDGNTGLTGDVVFTNVTSIGAYVFRDTRIRSIVVGPGVESLSDRFLFNIPTLEAVTFQATNSLSVGYRSGFGGAIGNCPNLSEYTFYCFPDFQTGWNNGSKKGTGVRVFIPRDNEGWNTALSNEVYTGWSKCGDMQAEYYENFGANAQKPSGYMTAPFEAWVLRFGADNGTMLMLK